MREKIACVIDIALLIVTTWICFTNCKAAKAIPFHTTEHNGHILPYWDPDPQYYPERRNQRKSILSDTERRSEHNSLHQKKRYKVSLNVTPKSDRYRYEMNRPLEADKLHLRANLKSNASAITGKTFMFRNDKKGTAVDSQSTRYTPMVLKDKDDTATTPIATSAPSEQNTQTESPKGEDKKEKKGVEEEVVTVYTVVGIYNKILQNFPSIQVEWETLGRTAAYNNIELMKLSLAGEKHFRAHDDRYVENEPKEKKIIFIVHALTPMGLNCLYSLTVLRYLKEVISYYVAHLDKFDIYLMPLANPDGYAMLKTKKYWSKNAAPMSACPGVHVDRNFDVGWNNTVELSSCHPHYPGPAPFSEPESKAVRDMLHRMSHKIVAFLHVHAGTFTTSIYKGDAILYPRGFTEAPLDDDKYVDLKGEIDEAIKNANFKVFSMTVDTLFNWYGRVSGTSVDYAATVYGIPYAMEMVMQLYQGPAEILQARIVNDYTEMEYFALTEIWRRVFNVTFTNIYRKIEGSDTTQSS